MDEKNEADKIDEIMLPGFRFHPTDEELVGFYLKRKVQQKPLSIELIKQLDIYKYDPWDLPKLATVGEKEWYFYCPRDRKYRNSARPNRVTGAGFWKATGTDRPIYSSEGTKCIGLKKSLVFYRGRAAKGIKTDWMMHEFRLPSLTDSSCTSKKPLDKHIPPNDSWAICRIFKKNNPMSQRVLCHSWPSPALKTGIDSDAFLHSISSSQFTSENISCTTETGSGMHACSNNELQTSAPEDFSSLNFPTFSKPNIPQACRSATLSVATTDAPLSYTFSPLDMLVNLSSSMAGDINKGPMSIDFGQQQQHNASFAENLQQHNGEEMAYLRNAQSDCVGHAQVATIRAAAAFPFNVQSNAFDALKASLSWDSSTTVSSEMTTTFSTNKMCSW
ncbi:unnamed protein product [Victoria cruziana]